jgi:outer membrane protein
MPRFASVALVVLLSAGAAAAQEPLTLDRAMELALAHNAALKAADAGVAEAAARSDQARAALFPRVTVSESWQRANDPVFVFGSLLSARRFSEANFAPGALNHPDALGFFRTTIGVEQVLFDGGRRTSAATSGALHRDIARTSSARAAAEIVLALTRTYGRILSLQASQRALDGAIAAAREDVARAERRRDAGIATDADVLALVVHVQDLRQRAIQAAGDAAVAAAELNRLTGAPIEHGAVAVMPAAVAEPDPGNLAALFTEADEKRPELESAALSERLAAAERRTARAALIPEVAARAAFEASGTRFTTRAAAWAVGGELRWTFSLGGAERAGIRAAAAAASRASAARADARAAVQVEIVSAVRMLQAARARQEAGAAAVAQARESQRIIRDRFDSGLASVNDVLRASAAVIDADAATTAASVDAIVAAAMLRKAIGRVR